MIIEDLRDATVMHVSHNGYEHQHRYYSPPRLDTRPQAGWRSEGAVKANLNCSVLRTRLDSLQPCIYRNRCHRNFADDATLGTNKPVINHCWFDRPGSCRSRRQRLSGLVQVQVAQTGVSTYSVGSRVKGSELRWHHHQPLADLK